MYVVCLRIVFSKATLQKEAEAAGQVGGVNHGRALIVDVTYLLRAQACAKCGCGIFATK